MSSLKVSLWTTILMATLLAAIISIPSGAAIAADNKLNPFTLTYDGAITENVKGKVNINPVTCSPSLYNWRREFSFDVP